MALFDLSNERREREREMRTAGRLPPGQSLTLKWPVLHEGSVPQFDPQTWDFRVFGLLEVPCGFRGTNFRISRRPKFSPTCTASRAGADSIIIGAACSPSRS